MPRRAAKPKPIDGVASELAALRAELVEEFCELRALVLQRLAAGTKSSREPLISGSKVRVLVRPPRNSLKTCGFLSDGHRGKRIVSRKRFQRGSKSEP